MAELSRYRLMDEADTAEARGERGNHLAAAGRYREAVEAYRGAVALAPEDPQWWTNLGNALLGGGETDEALVAYRKARALGLDHPLLFYNLGTALRVLGRSEEALTAFDETLARTPNFAPAHNNRGNALRDLRRFGAAAAAYFNALTLRPGDGGTRVNLASVVTLLYEEDPAAALRWARRWLDLDPDDPVAIHVAASLSGGPAPDRAGDDYVRRIFDSFAVTFEQRLAALEYRVPERIGEALARRGIARGDLEVLDAGCGTGLCGPFLRPYARTLTGVDLSGEMLELARARALYDGLETAELTTFLGAHRACFDLIVGGDVLCYFGQLAPVLEAAAAALRPGGRFLFSVEQDIRGATPYTLQPNGRYRHEPGALAATAAAAGFLVPEGFTPITLRQENDQAVQGLLIDLTTPSIEAKPA